MTVDGSQLLMDVYAPLDPGPWPIVVTFHPIDSNGNDDIDTVAVAKAAAAEGMVVFAPSWIVWDPPGPFPFTIDTLPGWTSAANCAIAFAQQGAAEYGGDPAATVLHGFSAGAGTALLAALEPRAGPIPGCETDASPTPAVGVVLGDGEYFLHSKNFEEAFAADPAAMQAQVAALTDASYWPADLQARFFLWIAASGTSPRPIVDPSVPTDWLAERDPNGTIRADLGRLNLLDDGIISMIDEGRLLELRLSEAGVDVTLDEFPGGHTLLDKVPAVVAYLKAAATR